MFKNRFTNKHRDKHTHTHTHMKQTSKTTKQSKKIHFGKPSHTLFNNTVAGSVRVVPFQSYPITLMVAPNGKNMNLQWKENSFYGFIVENVILRRRGEERDSCREDLGTTLNLAFWSFLRHLKILLIWSFLIQETVDRRYFCFSFLQQESIG